MFGHIYNSTIFNTYPFSSEFIVIFYSILFHSFCLWKAFILNFVYYCFKNQSDFFFLYLKILFSFSFSPKLFLLKISLQLDGIISSATFWGEEPVLNYSNGHLYLRFTCLSLSPRPRLHFSSLSLSPFLCFTIFVLLYLQSLLHQQLFTFEFVVNEILISRTILMLQ